MIEALPRYVQVTSTVEAGSLQRLRFQAESGTKIKSKDRRYGSTFPKKWTFHAANYCYRPKIQKSLETYIDLKTFNIRRRFQMKFRSPKVSLRPVVCLLVLIGFSGCAAMSGNKSSEPIDGIDTKAMRAAGYTFDETGTQKAIPTGDQSPSVILEVRDGKRHMEKIPMSPEKPLFIQDVIVDAKLEDKLGKIKVAILRPTGTSSPPIRMEADMEPNGKGVVKWQNYALQPGDQIVVTKDTTTWVDGMMKSVMPNRR